MKPLTSPSYPMDAQRKYVIRTSLFMSGYVLLNVSAIFGAFDDLRSPGSWLFALTAAAPIVGQVWAMLCFMRDSDEFVRGLMAKRFVIASGIAMSLFSSWGFLELYAHAAHVPASMVLPLFWLAFGVVCFFVKTSH